VGHATRVRVTKNKVAPPFRVAEFDIMFGEGISRAGDLIDVGLNLGIIEKRGSFYYHDGERFSQGRENAKTYVKETQEFADKIEKLIREQLVSMNETDIPLEMVSESGQDDDDDEQGGLFDD
ncbi:MAG: DNA recombination/repair protein RecA, partial [Anaerolineae bacterium]|nr:DNA recombination/repair protein RecA [Anaerolineae bacterium]